VIARLNISKCLIISLAATVVLATQTPAQSGRKKSEPPASVPVATPAPVESAVIPSQEKISSLVVSGEVTANSVYFRSNYLDLAIKEFIFWMKHEPRPFLAVAKGGKLKFEDALEASKKESERHMLWLAVSTKINGYGEQVVDFVDYAILVPQTGRTLINGRSYPGEEKIVAQGGVIRMPNTARRPTINSQIKQAARDLAFKLKATGWF
jgi:hypothetical protein